MKGCDWRKIGRHWRGKRIYFSIPRLIGFRYGKDPKGNWWGLIRGKEVDAEHCLSLLKRASLYYDIKKDEFVAYGLGEDFKNSLIADLRVQEYLKRFL